jgi:hypothetical protein
MSALTTASVIEPALAELSEHFAAFEARIPRGEHVPLDALAEMLAQMEAVVDTLPWELRDLPRKYVRGAEPVYRWSAVVSAFASALDELRYEVLAAQSSRACDCLVLVELGANARMPRSPRLRRIGWDYDGYYNADAYACDECGTRWWHGTEDTESQHSEWWEPRPSTWEPAKPPR